MNKYELLNPMQQEAVYHTDGPLLVLAGAGSGKTRVLTHRIAYLIEEKKVNPWNIMAITFTNKAAAEMRERVDKIVGFGSESIWVSTFHSSCVRILRRHIEYLGYSTNFTIYDGDDQKTLMKQIFKKLDVDTKQFKERAVLSKISSAKDDMITPEEFELNAGGDFREKKVAQIYKEYQKELKKNNALDFDDLIVKTVELFQNAPEVLDYYQERFRYIMVDEYQDTNMVQFKLVDLLAAKYRNICVVGDDDQSIYKFRGANIENILSFEKAFPGAKVIKLEQNYRSTQNILNAANEVIRNNRGRKDKTLWTANDEGNQVRFLQFDTAYEEAEAIVKDIRREKEDSGCEYSDFAVLYRTNAQSRLLEEKCILYSIPYRLVGGVNFYQRKEIKDILCYLKTISNGQDDLAVQRIVNVPKRGVGATSIGKVTMFASANGMSFYDALLRVKGIPTMGKAADKIGVFTEQIEDFKARMPEMTIQELIEEILENTGYKKELEAEGEIESETRLQNIEELINKAVSYSENAEEPTLDGFLEEVALVADVDNMDESENRIILMTLHSAKGLEFPYVYLSGLEDGLFPSSMSIMSDDKDAVEEERRLCYVGITRAREKLTLTAARQRMTNGETRFSKVSRFVEEIPSWLLEQVEQPSVFGRAAGRSWGGENSGNGDGFGGAAASGWGRKSSEGEEAGLPWNRSGGITTGWGSSAGGQNGAGDRNSSVSIGSGSGSAGGSGGGRGLSAFGQKPNAYASKTAPGAPSFGKAFSVQKASHLPYSEGDRVKHIKFGEGTVKKIEDGGKDYEVTVEFERVGVKKMFASFAKLIKL
ncbi:ATP-dependent helicase [uncultured Clostridium sp.]|uniref:ATP-dependent helicase n=1 Tax=uncultured Clostridium sp. TaxID=59620 RepID=UPI0025DC1FF7|nr:UvrD-helicase domain-containing protein [uncultured Clostridium sp.]